MRFNFSYIFILMVGVFFYTLTFRGVFGNYDIDYINNNLSQATTPFESSHERSPYAVLISLKNNKSFSLPKNLADFAAPDIGFYNGKFYSFFPPGLPLIIYPFYLLGNLLNLEQIFSYSIMVVFSLLTLIFIYKISREIFLLPVWGSLFASLSFAFATSSWSYAIIIYQHSLTTLLLILSFYSSFLYKKTNHWVWSAIVWFCYAIAIFVDYPNAILLLPVIFYLIISSFSVSKIKERICIRFDTMILLTSIVFIVINTLHGYYNFANYGDWKIISQTFKRYEIDNYQELTNEANENPNEISASRSKKFSSILLEERLPQGLYALLFSSDRGLFIYSPLLILSILGIYKPGSKNSLEKKILIICVIVNLFVYASFSDPWGGWAFGPRYLIPGMAILSIYSAVWISKKNKKTLRKIIAFSLFTISSAISLIGVLTTNLVPPKIEADYYGMKYGILANFDFLSTNTTGSIIFNTFLRNSVYLWSYFMVIYLFLLFIGYFILFIFPNVFYEN